jgi:hypothetical protein
VDWIQRTVILACAYFNDGLCVGDLLAIGGPLRPVLFVRVTASELTDPQGWLRGRPQWHFEEIDHG